MKRVLPLLTAILLTFTFSAAHAAATVEECKATMKTFEDLGNVSEMLAESYGYAVLPTIGKGGIGIGGAGGTGCVFEQGNYTGDVSMGQVTIGWQLGGQAYSQLVLFKNADTYNEFIEGNFEFGADATAVALTYGANDLGSIMLEENVVSAAGTTYRMGVEDMRRLIADLGYEPRQRDNWYRLVA